MKANLETIKNIKQSLSEDMKNSLKNITIIIDKEADLFRKEKQYSSAFRELGESVGRRDLAETKTPLLQSGWQCPVCQNIYSPFVESCRACSKSS